MKRILSILLVCAMLALAGCEEKASPPNSSITSKAGSAQTDEATPTDTYLIDYIPIDDTGLSIPSIDADSVSVEEAEYSRFGERRIFVSRKSSKFFENSTTELTAKIKITKYCGETDIKVYGDDVATLFKAKILTCYKGDFTAGDDIYVIQFFSGHGVYEAGYPLFGISDVMFLNLRLFKEQNKDENDNIFQVVPGRSGIVEIIKYDGVEYALNRGAQGYLDEFNAATIDDVLSEKILKAYREQDPIRERISPINQIYMFKDLEKYIIQRNFKIDKSKGDK